MRDVCSGRPESMGVELRTSDSGLGTVAFRHLVNNPVPAYGKSNHIYEYNNANN